MTKDEVHALPVIVDLPTRRPRARPRPQHLISRSCRVPTSHGHRRGLSHGHGQGDRAIVSGIELEIVALDPPEPVVVIHVMPSRLRR